MTIPQWEACKVCGGDHWTQNHGKDSMTPTTKAGRWLLDRTNWNDGMRGFFVRINATAGADDMFRHIIAIENEARAPLEELIREQCAAQDACGCYRRVILGEKS